MPLSRVWNIFQVVQIIQIEEIKYGRLVRRGRDISRKKADDTFSNQPDNPETDQTVARENAVDIPMLILLKQNGDEGRGWRGAPFWWPVLWTHRDTQTVIFASDINEDNDDI